MTSGNFVEEIRLTLEKEMKEREATERALLDERRRLEEEV